MRWFQILGSVVTLTTIIGLSGCEMTPSQVSTAQDAFMKSCNKSCEEKIPAKYAHTCTEMCQCSWNKLDAKTDHQWITFFKVMTDKKGLGETAQQCAVDTIAKYKAAKAKGLDIQPEAPTSEPVTPETH